MIDLDELERMPAPYTCKHGCERDALKDENERLRDALSNALVWIVWGR